MMAPAAAIFPPLSLALALLFKALPTYWDRWRFAAHDFKALNLSDRLSGCAKLAKRMLGAQKHIFQFSSFSTPWKALPPKSSTSFSCASI